ncbi:MAG: hypothetical protein ACJ79E_05835 [Anaeromyxobacteraceae bacterium]
MLRAAAWTGGLFAVGGGICHLFPGPFIEPLVLIALGSTLLFVSGRAPAAQRSATTENADPAPATSRSVAH